MIMRSASGSVTRARCEGFRSLVEQHFQLSNFLDRLPVPNFTQGAARPKCPASRPTLRKGYVTRFLVAEKFLDRYQVREAGGKDHLEYWIPAEDLGAFNDAII